MFIILQSSNISEQTSSRQSIDMALASANADPNVRTVAVKELIKSISGKDVSAIEDIVRSFQSYVVFDLIFFNRTTSGAFLLLEYKTLTSGFLRLYTKTRQS